MILFFEFLRHFVERGGQPADFIAGPDFRPRIQVSGGDGLGCGNEMTDRSRNETGQQYPEQGGQTAERDGDCQQGFRRFTNQGFGRFFGDAGSHVANGAVFNGHQDITDGAFVAIQGDNPGFGAEGDRIDISQAFGQRNRECMGQETAGMVKNQQVPKVFGIASEFVDKFAQRIDVIDQNGAGDKRRDMPGHFNAPFFDLPVIHFV